jgi:hypothetical protein
MIMTEARESDRFELCWGNKSLPLSKNELMDNNGNNKESRSKSQRFELGDLD